LLPIEEFGWIKGERRQEIWLYHRPDLLPLLDPSQVAFIDGIPGLSTKEAIILRFDLSSVTLDEKLKRLRWIVEEWNKLVDESGQLKWLEKTNAKQCEWAWSYIRKTAPTGHLKFSFEREEPYIAVLAVFDTAFSHPAERSLFFGKMRDAWNQFKHREKNMDKTQCNFWLATEAKAALDQLAVRKGMKKNQLIEYLIYQELHKLDTGV
jgi:hypothetical protein